MSETQNQSDAFQPGKRSWFARFAGAFRGVRQGATGQPSFIIHLVIAIAVLILAAVVQVSLERWCILLLCIGIVIAAELFNSSLEWLCRSVTKNFDPNIERALNIASGAVLVASITAAIIGCLIFADAIW